MTEPVKQGKESTAAGLYEMLFRQHSSPVLLASLASGQVVAVSDRFVSTFGYTEGPLLGCQLADAPFWEVGLAPVQLWSHQTAGVPTVECNVVTGKGTTQKMEITASVMNHDAERYLTLLFKDIVQQKQYYGYLRESEERFRNLIDTAPFGILVISLEGKVLLANRQCADLHQTDHPDNLLGLPITDLVAVADRKLFTSQLGLLLKSRGRQEREYLLRRADDSVFCGEVIASLQIGAEGKPTAYTLVERDISATKAAYDEILKMSRAVEQSINPIVITDAKGRVEYVNQRFCLLTGYDAGDIKGKGLGFLAAAQHSPEAYRDMAQTVRAGGEWQGELCNAKRSGELYWSRETVSPVKDANGVLRHYLSIQEDISGQKEMERTLQERNDQLEKAMEILRQSQTRLIQQEKMAGVGQLAAGVAHEINNPLGFVISNFASLEKYLNRLRRILGEYRELREVVATGELIVARERAEQVESLERELKMAFILDDLADLFHESHEGLERVRKIVKSLRAFSRIDSTANYEGYDLNEGLQETLVVAKNEVKHCAVVEEEYGDVPLISAVGGQINQVLLNIIVNAAQAIRQRHGEHMGLIRVRTWSDGETVSCAIEDNGPGIQPEHLGKLFEPFFTTKPVGQGTGLGLSISYDIIVNKHHGELLAENRQDGGVCFLIRLPVRQPVENIELES